MMKKLRIVLFLIVLCMLAFIAENTNAQTFPIKIKLHQPPPGQLNANNLWKATLTNTSGNEMKISLEGYAEEQSDGRIVEGQTAVFKISPGDREYKYEDFKNGSVKWSNKKYETVLLRTGNAPAGTYTICMTAKNEEGTIVGMEQCIMQVIGGEVEQEIMLIQPGNGDEIKLDADAPILFAWTAGTKGPYTLRIVEIRGDQSPDAAMKENTAFFEQKEIKGTTFQYPISAPKFEKGKNYGWRISSGNVNSDVFLLKIIITDPSVGCFKLDTLQYKVICNGVNAAGQTLYRITNLTLTNIGTNPGKTGLNAGPATSYITPTGFIVGNLTPASAINIMPTNSINISFDIIGATGSTVTFIVKSSITLSGGLYCDKTIGVTVDLPKCSCCEGFVKKVQNFNISQYNSSTDSYNLTAILTAGTGTNTIKKATTELVYFSVSPPKNAKDSACTMCVSTSKSFGNFGKPGNITGLAGPFLSPRYRIPAPTYSREITWGAKDGPGATVSGVNVTIPVFMPKPSNLTCCSDTIRMGVKFSFTDTSCVTCDTVIYRKYKRTSTGITAAGNSSKRKMSKKIQYILEDITVNNTDANSYTEDLSNINTADVSNEVNDFAAESDIPSEQPSPITNTDIVSCGIKGWKFNDLNGNSTRDMGEPGLPGWTIELYQGSTLLGTRITNSVGYYSFQSNTLLGGTYIVKEVNQSGWTQTCPVGGSYTVYVAAGGMSSNKNFGNQSTVPPKDCCKGFNMTVGTFGSNPIRPVLWNTQQRIEGTWRMQLSLTAGPRRIKKITANLESVEMSSTPNCEKCLKNSFYYGNFHRELTAANIPSLTGPNLTLHPDVNASRTDIMYSREIKWGSDDGNGINMTTPKNITIFGQFPPPGLLDCCSDTIKYCIRFKFTDTTCVTCDTLMCYTIIQKGSPTGNNNSWNVQYSYAPNKMNEHYYTNTQEDSGEMSDNIYKIGNENRSLAGQSAGILKVDVDKRTNVKLNIYDSHGKEVLKVYDAYMKEGQYNFDLNRYNLADGVYFYRLENNGKTRYEKVLITNPANGCNCGK